MSVARFSVGSAMVLLSTLGLLVCIAGIAAAWMVKDRVDAIGTVACSAAADSLAFVSARVELVNQAMATSRRRVSGISKAAERLGEAGAEVRREAEPLLQGLDEIFAQLRSAESWIDSSRAVAQSVAMISQEVVTSQYAASHDDSTGIEIVRRLQEASERVAEALAKLQVLRQEIVEARDTGKLAREVAARVISRVANLDGVLAIISARIETFDVAVAKTKGSIDSLQQRIGWWTALGAVASWAVLAWFGISQIGMLGRGRRMIGRGR